MRDGTRSDNDDGKAMEGDKAPSRPKAVTAGHGPPVATRASRSPSPPLASLPVIPYAKENVCLERGCTACCRGTEMLLTDADVTRISAARPGADFHFQADDGYLQLKTRAEDTSPCVFLALDGRCSIHDVRPEGCRLYPGVWDGELRRAHLDTEHCPHTDGFLLPRTTVDAVTRLARRLDEERTRRLRSPL